MNSERYEIGSYIGGDVGSGAVPTYEALKMNYSSNNAVGNAVM